MGGREASRGTLLLLLVLLFICAPRIPCSPSSPPSSPPSLLASSSCSLRRPCHGCLPGRCCRAPLLCLFFSPPALGFFFYSPSSHATPCHSFFVLARRTPPS